MASPAELLRSMLIAGGLVQYPAGQEQDLHAPITYCFANVMPNDPPQALCIADTAGIQFGRVMAGQTLQHHGLKLNMRHEDERKGYDPLKAIFDFIDAFPPNQTVRSRGVAYHVVSVYNVSSILSLGEEPGTKRYLWSLNVRMSAGILV